LPLPAFLLLTYSIGNFLNLATNISVLGLTAFLLWFIHNNNKKRDAGKYDHYLDGVRPEEAYKLGTTIPGLGTKRRVLGALPASLVQLSHHSAWPPEGQNYMLYRENQKSTIAIVAERRGECRRVW
jgi:hypothetical protein